MNYSRLQKWLSSFLIFSLLFLQTFQIPFLGSTQAEAKVNADIVSFIVDDAIYSGAVKSKIFQYAQDVQAYLPNTRVVIFPVQKTANPFAVASINEKLFYEGDGEGLSRLVGTILIGEVPLPVVHKDDKAFMSIYPYVDFDNKSFVYDQIKKSYEYTTKTLTNEKPEVWHSVIRPNTGDESKNKDELVTFFNKTHDFYNKQGLFSAENTPNSPRVFYMDAFHDQQSSSPDSWKSYLLYLENIEDIAYHRFNKYLAQIFQNAAPNMNDTVMTPAIQALLDANSSSTLDTSKSPDITTKDIIEKSAKQFFEVLSSKYMGDILRYVNNTGRYNDGTNVLVDTTPVVIAKKDLFMRTSLKDSNTLFESVIDNLVKTQLAEPLKIATEYTVETKKTGSLNEAPNTTRTYKNYFFGQEASQISDMSQCSIVRGNTSNSGVIVEANRGYNINNIQSDVTFLSNNPSASVCLSANTSKTMSYWGGNSGLNLNKDKIGNGEMVLNTHIYKDFINPLFDIAGSKELAIDSLLHPATPLDCLDNNMLLQPYRDTIHTRGGGDGDYGSTSYEYWPKEKNGTAVFDCTTVHKPLDTPFADYYTYLNGSFPSENCTIHKLKLDGVVKKTSGAACFDDGGDNGTASSTTITKTYSFKTLSTSIVEHKSPTDEEYAVELQNMITPSLPSDRERYVDFINKQAMPNITVSRISYPNLFRIILGKTELNYFSANKKVKELLDAKSTEIATLNGTVDLYHILSTDQKALNTVIEGVIWNNMKNATLKYSNTLERSLNIDGEQKISADNKKNDYEIAYLGAPGDATNMYINVDPGSKGALPADIAAISDKVNNYNGLIDATNISSTSTQSANVAQCGPPTGVPIGEWFSAIQCWIKTILPPTIGAGSCSSSSNASNTNNTPSSFSADPNNTLDANKNGILDGYEIIGGGDLKLQSPLKVSGYNETIPLVAELTKNGKIIDIDSFNVVSFGIKKLTVLSGGNNPTATVVYDRNATGANASLADITNIIPYINFKPMDVRAQNGIASYSFSTKSDDVNVIFDAHIFTQDSEGNTVVDKISDPITFNVRSERISVQAKIKNIGASDFTSNSVISAENSNGILLNLQKIGKGNTILPSNFPYTLSVYDDIGNTLLRGPINVPSNEYFFNDQTLLNKSGVYRFVFKDNAGINGFTTMTVLPALPVKIEATPASNIFIAGEKTTVVVKILDKFGNLATGEMYKLSGSISGGAEFMDLDGKKLGSTTSKNVTEGYTSFDVTNTQTSNAMNLSFRIDSVNVSSDTIMLRSIDFAKISVNVSNKGNIVVGKEPHIVKVSILDRNNQILSGYNGIVSLDFPKLSGTLSSPFIHIVNGISNTDVTIIPAYVAGKDLRIQAQIPGISTIEGNIITVLPDVPMSFSFSKKFDRMEARDGNLNDTQATLYDRYGNVAYNTTGYTLSLRIPETYRKFASIPDNSYLFIDGILHFNIVATSLPGKAYIIGKVSPGLESNSFTVTDKSNNSVTVNGISENLTTLDTYYIFNKSKLDTMRYDAQYTVLLGGQYGDVTQKEYLGGEILFNHDSKSLAVTTLLNNPWSSPDLFGFTPAGKYTYVKKTDDTGALQATIGNDSSKSFISFYDSYRKEYIARAWLNIDPNVTSYLPCTSLGSDITNCDITTQTTVFMKGLVGNTAIAKDGGLTLMSPNDIPLARINSGGKMEKYGNTEFVIDDSVTSNLLGIKIVSLGVQIGYIGIKFSSDSVNTTSPDRLQTTLSLFKNRMVFEAISQKYVSHKTHLGISSRGSEGIMFAYNDIATGEFGKVNNAYLTKSVPNGLEQYPTKTGIGWEDTNRMFLEVAAGTTIGNATKFYQTFSTITLGDAVSHLPAKVSAANNFDRTIGTQISIGNGEQIESYKKIDVNADSVPDMVIFYDSGKIQLLMNYGGTFKDMGYLAYVSDGGKGRKGVGDFFGDGYDDIALSDAKGKLIVLDNIQGKFVRTDPVIMNESGAVENLHGFIQQLELFDMDADGKTDIVTLDDSGEMNILYGTVTADGKHTFTKHLVENSLGLKLSQEVRNDGGAFSYAELQFPTDNTPLITPDSTGTVDQSMINNIIYYKANYQSDNVVSDSTGTVSGSGNADRVFIRSAFAEGKGLKVEKTYRIMSTTTKDIMQTGDKIRVEIVLTNTTSRIFRDAVYLDSNVQKIFKEDQEGIYTITTNSGAEQQLPLKYITEGDFDYGFDFGTMAPGAVVKIRYLVTAIPSAFGQMNVGLLEKGETGDDKYGDISLSPNNMCGGELMMWRSVEPYPRSYEKGTKKFVDNSVLPPEVARNSVDLNKNGIPDYLDAIMADSGSMANYSNEALADFNASRTPAATTPVVSYNQTTGEIEIGGLTSDKVDAVNSGIDEIVKGLGCGFGGGGCISSPINYAPLAPGSAPAIMGMPIMELKPDSGLPVFSALTGLPLPTPAGCIPIPVVWPLSPIGLESTCTTNDTGAGGWLGTNSASNFFRLFITPTITGATGVAMCFGPAGATGNLPPAGVSPLVPGGNCIVAAQPLASCKNDGSNGDAGSLGLGSNSGNSSVNANSCIQGGSTFLSAQDRNNLIGYIGGDNSRLPEINASIANGSLANTSAGPIVGIGNSSGGDSNFSISIDAVALASFDVGNIVKIKNTRVSSDPGFLMDWVTNQLEEIVNKITSLPTLYIILPDFSGLDFAGYADITTKFSNGKTAAKDANPKANSLEQNVSGIKSAFEFMSHLPLLKLQTEMVDINVPWLSAEEMDKWLTSAKGTANQWKTELADKKMKWYGSGSLSNGSHTGGISPDKQIIINAEGLIGSLQENINIIEEYKKFPEKFQKYLTWKERYVGQLLCNVEAIENMMGGWISDNGQRFKTWVELYILIKAILKSWQGILDLFYGYEAECSVCRNERGDLKHFMFKLISALIPSIPIIQFPKWPDIILDIHNIRAGIRILMPEFHFNFVPMILPQLPNLYLPNVPTVNVNLPNIPLLPRLPELPELPDLPSLPVINLPNLPPPPTIPKLPGSIAGVLGVFKIIAKVLCIMRINPFVPEWRAGDQIAQITERTGTLPMDFIRVEFPQFTYSAIDAIKIESFVNLEFETDFIVAMSKLTLDPLNKFTSDLSNIGGFLTIPDVNLRDTVPGNIDVNIGRQGYVPNKNAIMVALLKKLSFDVLHDFVALNLYISKHSKEEVTVAELKDILTDNISLIRDMHDTKALAIADILQKAVSYSGENETKFIEDLSNQNTEKFRLIKDYIKGEKMETTILKTEMDNVLRTGTIDKETAPSLVLIGGENIKARSFSTDVIIGDDLKQKILTTNERVLPSLERIRTGGRDAEVKEIEDMGADIVTGIRTNLDSYARDIKRNESIHRLAYQDTTGKLLGLTSTSSIYSSAVAADSSSTSSSTDSSTASAYNYTGIYILDKNNKQVHLFDYVDGVDGKEEVIYSDVDKDGDEDIIYRMGNSLYLKKNFQMDAQASHFSDSPKVFAWQNFLQIVSDNGSSKILSAPNHFEETFITSGEINFSFQPANYLSDNFFRFEYYDYIDRFDKINSGENPLLITPKTPVHKVDLVPELLNETVFDTNHTGFIGRKNTVSFGRSTGEATVTMNMYQYATPETNSANPITISEGRTIYTDAGGATISYMRDNDTEAQTLSLSANTNYEFLQTAKIWVQSGKLYLFKASLEQKQVNLNDFYGMPVMPETKIELINDKSYASFSYYDGSSMRLDGPGTYNYYPLGTKAEQYAVSLSAPNDWYYSKLSSFQNDTNSTILSLNLISPQKQADKEGPLITYGDKIRIPVYQKQIINLKSYIDDISGIDSVWIDADQTKDTDRDGDVKNDKDSLDSNSSYGIKKGNTIYDLNIGPFDTLFTKKITLFTKDGNGNISSKDLTLTVYPPVPNIESITGSIVSGRLDETLGDEPVDIFRLRNGVITRIESTKSNSGLTRTDGTFHLPTKDTNGIVLTESGNTIATINERTGKITLDDTSFHIAVVGANSDSPLQIQILSSNNRVVFSERIHISATSTLEETSSFDSVTGTGIFVLPNTGFSFVKNTLSSPDLPDGGYIIDSNHKALTGISKTGDIYLMNPAYRLIYTTKDSSVILQIVDSGKNIVANILYKIDAEYVIK